MLNKSQKKNLTSTAASKVNIEVQDNTVFVVMKLTKGEMLNIYNALLARAEAGNAISEDVVGYLERTILKDWQ